MRRLIFTLLAVLIASLPLLAMPQGLNTAAPWQTGGGKVLASFPLTTSGPLITEDANTVAHVYWNGSALVDTKGNSWTMNGTVPQVTASPFTTTRYGAGPFSAANKYSLASTNPLQFAGDFTVCVVFSPAEGAVAGTLLSVGSFGASGSGYYLYIDGTGRGRIGFLGAASANVIANTTAIYPATRGPNILCGGLSGTTASAKVDLGTTATNTVTYTRDTTNASLIGSHPQFGTFAPMTGTIYEVYATSTAFSEATVTAIQQKVLGHFDGSSELSVTRTTNATYLDGSGNLWTAAPGVARITTDGLLVEPQRTNYVLNAATHPKTSEATGSITATAACVGWHDGTGTMTIVNGTATTTGLSCSAVAAGTLCTFTVTGTGTMAITTTSGTTRAQIECPGSYRTSFIATTTTSATRNADAVSATVPAVPSKWCVATDTKFTGGASWPSDGNAYAWALGGNGANSAYMIVNTGTQTVVNNKDGTGALRSAAVAPAISAANTRSVYCNTAGLQSGIFGGVTATATNSPGTGLFSTVPTTLGFGGTGTTFFGGFLKNLKICKATKTKECP